MVHDVLKIIIISRSNVEGQGQSVGKWLFHKTGDNSVNFYDIAMKQKLKDSLCKGL